MKNKTNKLKFEEKNCEKCSNILKTKTLFKKHMQIAPALELFEAKMLELSIGSDIAEQIGYQL